MLIRNPFQMNDWEIGRFFRVILGVQVLVWACIGLEYFNVPVPLVRPLVCFIYLTFVPGIILLRVLKVHRIGASEVVVYSVGLSLSVLMFGMLMTGVALAPFGIKPFAIGPISVAMSIIVLALCGISYVRDRQFSKPEFFDTSDIISPQVLFLLLIPFLAIFGTYLMNANGNNVLQLVLLVILMAFPVAVALRMLPQKYYALAIFVIALSILLHTTLISPNVWGADVNSELSISNTIIHDQLWNQAIPTAYNSMLSIVMLVPLYSIFLHLNATWIFKIVFSILFSFVPLGLFIAYKNQTNAKIAFFASFLFLSFFDFYVTLPSAAREEIGLLFLTLLLVIISRHDIKTPSITTLTIIFGASLVVSHYGTTYVFLILIIAAWLVVRSPLAINLGLRQTNGYKILGSSVLLLCVLAYAWYAYVSNGINLTTVVNLGNNIVGALGETFASTPGSATNQVTGFSGAALTLLQSAEWCLDLAVIALSAAGLLYALHSLRRGIKGNERLGFNGEFVVISLCTFGLIGAGYVVPYLAKSIGTDRFFDISLIFLAPYAIVGGAVTANVASQLLHRTKPTWRFGSRFNLVAAFLVVFLLFNSAFIYQVLNEPKLGRFALDQSVDFYVYNNGEVAAANWLSGNGCSSAYSVYVDVFRAPLLGSVNLAPQNQTVNVLSGDYDINTHHYPGPDYLFEGTYNIQTSEFLLRNSSYGVEYEHDPYSGLQMSQIYDSGAARVLVVTR